MITLRTNLAVHRMINEHSVAISSSTKKLSSGFRINSASDDAAGLQISNRLSSQIMGMNQAIRNSTDAYSIAQAAEGSLSSVTDIVQRMRTLAIQSASDSNTASDRVALNNEFTQLKREISRIANDTTYGGKNLLDGSFQESFQIGADAAQTIELDIDGFDVTEIGSAETKTVTTLVPDTEMGRVRVGSPELYRVTFDSSSPPTRPVSSQWDAWLPFATSTTPTGGTSPLLSITDYNSTKEVVAAINALNANVTASTQTHGALSFDGIPDPKYNTVPYPNPIGISFDLKGDGGTVPISASITDFQDKSQIESLVDQINGKSGSTGIRAVLTQDWISSIGDYYGVDLIDETGGNVSVSNFAVSNPDDEYIEVSFGAKPRVGITSPNSPFPSGALYRSRPLPIVNEVNAIASGFLILNDETGNQVDVYEEETEVPTGTFTSVTTTEPAILLDDADILTHDNAQIAIEALDGALKQLGSQRGEIGAVQNRITSIISSNQNANVNLNSSLSRIKDTDFAKETALMIEKQIKLDAANAIATQANDRIEQLLPLLETML